MKNNYYNDYLILLNIKKYDEEEITISFEDFFYYYKKIIIFAENNNFELNESLNNNDFYKKFKEQYYYNEGIIDYAKDKIEQTQKITGEIANYFKQLNFDIKNVTPNFLKVAFRYIKIGLSRWYKIGSLLNSLKAKVISESLNTFEYILTKILKINPKYVTREGIKKQLEDQNVLKKIREYISNPTVRLIVGGLLAFLIIFIWTQSAFSGNPLFDFNIETYSRLLGSEDIFNILTVEQIIEIILWYALAGAEIATSLPAWLGTTVGNLSIIGILLFLNFIIANASSIIPESFKNSACNFLKEKKMIGTASKSLILFKEIGQAAGMIGTKNLKTNICVNAKPNNTNQQQEIKT